VIISFLNDAVRLYGSGLSLDAVDKLLEVGAGHPMDEAARAVQRIGPDVIVGRQGSLDGSSSGSCDAAPRAPPNGSPGGE
jgi:hypothetical protein